jgi:molybdate transport system substrate-binding protein
MALATFARSVLAFLAAAAAAPAAAQDPPAAEATLAVAASLRTALPALIERFTAAAPGAPLVATYGGSGALQKQVEAGAPIDAVVLAAAAPVDALIAGGHARAETRRVIGYNQLALIVPKGGAPVRFATLDQLPAGERIAIGDPTSVPVGTYARDALRALGLWDRLQPRFVSAPDVAAVLAYARRGEVGAAVVYRSDVLGLADVEVRELAAGDWAPRPEIVAAVTRHGLAGPRAESFLAFLGGAEARAILREHGFETPAAP